MAYSAKKYWTLGGSALALWGAAFALLIWLHHNHTDPVSVGLFRVAVAWIVVGLAMRALSYRDEVQRQSEQKRWFQGSMIGIAAMAPLVVTLQTHTAWLDAAVQFILRHPATPTHSFNLGILIPVIFQVVSVLVLKLLDKLSKGPQS
jgi:hypothetical protein